MVRFGEGAGGRGQIEIVLYSKKRHSLQAITDLLHRAYARNAAAGLRFVATHQTPEITAERLADGTSLVAEIDGQMAGVVTLYFPADRPYGAYDPGYDIASFGQFAVDPQFQGQGIGNALLNEVERLARELGAPELALDTAQPAADLIAHYQSRGFKIVAAADWRPTTNYESWILTKRI